MVQEQWTGALEVEVCVLGPVEVRGALRPLRRAWTMDPVVYLAMHRHPVPSEQWATALWPDRLMAPATLYSTASAARRSLGRSRRGHDHLPTSHGTLALAPTVGSDWEQLRQLAVRTEPDAWRAALFLVRGRPFCGLRNPDWTVLEGIEAEITETVADLALRLAEHHLAARDGGRAAAVARRGLLACPFDERLYRVLLRAADASGNPAGVESAMSELLGAVAGVPVGVRPIWPESLALVHPETAALYEALTRRPAPAPGGSLARL